MHPTRTYTALLSLVIALFYGGFLALWLSGHHEVSGVWADLWGVYLVLTTDPLAPPLPFFDLYGTLSWRDCHLVGQDVMAFNPCDIGNRPSNYSPLWYLLPTGGRDMHLPLSFSMAGIFLVLLPLLLRPASWGEFAYAALAAISSAVFFAIERANVDILMFLMTLAALWLWRSGRGWPAYGVMLAAAFLKFYPVALFALAAREPVRRFATIAAICSLLVALFVAIFWSELVRLPALMPREIYFGDMFGAQMFALGVMTELRLAPIVKPLLTLLLLGLGLWGALRTAGHLGPRLEQSFWTSREGALLLGGALVIVCSFLLTANIAYRGIFLLMTLPGLFVLRRGISARLAGWGLIAILVCLYSEPLRRFSLWLRGATVAVDQPGYLGDNIPEMTFFLVHEAAWWALVALLSGVILAFLRQTQVFAMLMRNPRPA